MQHLVGNAVPGDLLAVRLTVTGDDWRYLMVEDLIRAGTESIERDDLYEIRSRPTNWHSYARRGIPR